MFYTASVTFLPARVKDALTRMIGFGPLLIALLSLIVAIIAAISQKK
ncbi:MULTISPECIES: putative holin-like toxin [Brevibacillus]|jgi:Putative Holin-like Toxin (Hol-Tox)|nr:putative holin-like toxin [Brevibacillus borstelensis]MED1747018.1 putative holin-like toxin [Brevibacillus borstelensis]MED1883947.1 putative holin-like toxin [Brevibacillus borstelensis]MED2011289.1 putative holin-like toxin [Brevibacillus borstelensis]